MNVFGKITLVRCHQIRYTFQMKCLVISQALQLANKCFKCCALRKATNIHTYYLLSIVSCFLCFEFWCLILSSPDNSCFKFSSSVIYTVLHIRCSIDSSLISRAVFFFINGTLDLPFHNKRHSMFHAFNHDAYCPTLPWKGTGFGCCPTNSYANPPPNKTRA